MGVYASMTASSGWVPAKVELFSTRWRTAARAVRAGYNVLLMDTDVLLFDDPYKYLKSTPFDKYQILAQAKLLNHQDQYPLAWAIDAGIVYIQNAKPDGPAAWLLAEVTDRLLRWMDDGHKTLTAKSLDPSCNMRDEDMLNDVLASSVAGRPIFYHSVLDCQLPATRDKLRMENEALRQRLEKVMDWTSRVQTSNVELLTRMWHACGNSTTMLRGMDIKVPYVEGADKAIVPEELGGSLYPSQRGKLSTQFREQLQSACKDCKVWPDFENPEHVAHAKAQPTEKLLLLPPWLAATYDIRGRLGYWHRRLNKGTPRQVMAHAHSESLHSSTVGKAHLRMVYDLYDWELAHKVKGQGAFFASRDGEEVPEVVTVHPDLVERRDLTREQFMQMVDSIVQVAQYTRKTIGWPAVPCDLPWVLGPNLTQPPLPSNPEWIPHFNSNDKLMCTWARPLSLGCLGSYQGVTPLEFEHLKEQYRVFRPLDPSPEKTLIAQGRADPDYTKKLPWKDPQEINWMQLQDQVTLVMELPGHKTLKPENRNRMHAVYLGQPLKLVYQEDNTNNPTYNFEHHHRQWKEASLPTKSQADHAKMFKAFKEKCVLPPK
eukprot:CAMPEP_0202910010 /NCGR_PEP_ID=MMETSP1392-20130828/50857_1 /ASSEMBLY_ACC=CAM_ASM_000868 /TAXON_ID=225041 /ORGANISM="Chlamydomonas chlamydogama, Strain SAG 11-48b" /LENGTH=599 /DNA_ID=CAMNT_0049599963 /DNA_START=380 /DNA_END=2179 /DNA_ORIENTATION=+